MAKQSEPEYFQTTDTIIQMMILSAGAYSLIWFWRSWSLVKASLGLKVSPGWRAFFSNFNIHTLARDINWLLDSVKIKPSLQPYQLLGVAWIAVIIRGGEGFSQQSKAKYVESLVTAVIGIAITTWLIVLMQRRINHYLHKAPAVDIGPRNNIIYWLAIFSAVATWASLLAYLYAAISGVDPLAPGNFQ